jgi:hypothetical protein
MRRVLDRMQLWPTVSGLREGMAAYLGVAHVRGVASG